MPRNFEGVLAVEGELQGFGTGDGRQIDRGAVWWEDGPWPLRWQETSTPGHDNAVVVGTIERLWRDGDNIRGAGVFHDDSQDPATVRAVGRVTELIELDTVGVSIGFDDEAVEFRMDKGRLEELEAEFEAWWNGDEIERDEVDGKVILGKFDVRDETMVFTRGRFREATIVDTGAIADAAVELSESQGPVAVAACLELVSKADRAAAFQNPKFGATGDEDDRLVWQEPSRPEELAGWGCPLTIDDDGRIYGHATLRYRCHGSFSSCLPPPEQDGDTSRFTIGDASGAGIPTGPIILDTTHGVESGRVKSETWLADTGMAVADVAVGWDVHGMWVAGRVRPGTTEKHLAALRGSTLSCEWHPVGGKLRLIGILAVNSPGYLVQRRGVAASFTVGAQPCCQESTLTDRMATLEQAVALLLRRN